jgi:hypothetical protein
MTADNNTRLAIRQDTLEIQAIKNELNFLLCRYARSQDQAQAKLICHCMEKMLPHIDQLGFCQDRCGFYRLLRCWRMKAIMG